MITVVSRNVTNATCPVLISRNLLHRIIIPATDNDNGDNVHDSSGTSVRQIRCIFGVLTSDWHIRSDPAAPPPTSTYFSRGTS